MELAGDCRVIAELARHQPVTDCISCPMCGEVCGHRPLGVDSLRQSLYVIVHRQRVWNTYLISLQEVSVTVAPSGTRRIALAVAISSD